MVMNTTLDDLLDDEEPIGYAEIAVMTGREEQSVRTRLVRRKRHIRAHGKPRRSDIPEPAFYERLNRVVTPRWRTCDIVRWGMREGMIDIDGVTPIPYRGVEPDKDKRKKKRAAA